MGTSWEELDLTYYKSFVEMDNVVYCFDITHKWGAKFVNGKWEKAPYMDYDEWSKLKHRSLSNKETVERFLDNPPSVVFEQYQNERSDKLKAHFDKLIKENKVQVVEWRYGSSAPKLFRGINTIEDGDLAYAAVINDIRNHGYDFEGEDYQDLDCFLVFSNGTYEDYSLRGFSGIMAAALADSYADMAYAGFMFRAENPKLPQDKFYYSFKTYDYVVDTDTYKHLFDAQECYLGDNLVYMHPLDNDDQNDYRHNDTLRVMSDNAEPFELDVEGVITFYNKEEFDTFINDHADVCDYRYDEIKVEEAFKKGAVKFIYLNKFNFPNG